MIQRTLLGVVLAAVFTAHGTSQAAAEPAPIRNPGFEISDQGTTCQSIPGWTLHGAPASSIRVVEQAGEPVLQVSRGKAFCYGLPISPTVDYVLTIRCLASGARAVVEANPPLPGGQVKGSQRARRDWETLEVALPAAQRRAGIREMWLSLGAEPTGAVGAVWYQSVRLEPAGGGPNIIPNPIFAKPVVETTVPDGWSMDSGGATVAVDPDQAHGGSCSLKVTGVGRPVRISQQIDLTALSDEKTRRIRISGWGKSRGLGSDRIRLEVYGATPTARPLLSLTGDSDWSKGEIILDRASQEGRNLSLWINAPRAFDGDAWFDDIRVEPVPDTEVVNLLANASFRPSRACPGLPDFWGLYGDAVLCIEPWTLDYFAIVDEPGPFPTAGVLRVEHPKLGKFVPIPPNQRLAVYVVAGSTLELPKRDYTFSVYVKAGRPNTLVHLQHPASRLPLATARVGPKWQRLVATGTDAGLLPTIHVPEPDSIVWLSAPQLETGTTATAFRPSPGEADVASPRAPAGPGTRRRTGSRGDDSVAEPLPVPPLAIYAEYDHVRDDATLRARVEWRGPTPAVIHWRLLDATTGVALPTQRASVGVDAPGIHTFTIPTSDLPPGAIGIHAIGDSAGTRIGRATDVFTKIAGSGSDIRINRFSRSLVVDGDPLLPIFLPIEPATLGDWHLDRLAKAGFNCLAAAPGKLAQEEIVRGSVPSAKVADIRRQLDRLHARGMRLLWPIPWTFVDWGKTGELYGGNIARLAATYEALVSAFRDHPAILGWYLMDEPSPHSWERECGFAESDLHALWLAVKEADPGRPAYVNWNHAWQIEPYGGFGCTDVVGHDNYELSGESFDYGALLPGVQMVNDFRAGRRPAFVWISGSYDEVAMRPSAGAMRVHAWLHLIYGTRGLGYWSKPPLDPQAWEEMKTINREAVGLHKHVFGMPDAALRAIGPQGAGIHHALWTVQDVAYVLAVNTADTHETIHADVATACGRAVESGRSVFENRELLIENGVLHEECEPLGRYLYRFTLVPADP